jgi:flagellar hook-associated protein 3 FlgL
LVEAVVQVDPNYISNLSSAISASTAQEQTLTSELSSGLAVATLSDNPVAASANVGLAGSLAQLDSFVQSSNTTQGLLQVTDSTLGEVVTQLTSAVSLATQGANGTLNAADMQSISKEVAGIRDTVLSLANTSYQGSYIFSGSQGSVKPFTLNTNGSMATVTYSGDAATSSVVTPGGQSLQVNVPGSAVFTASGASVLGTLNQLVSDLASGSTSAVAGDATALSSALGNVNQQRATIDTSLSQLTETTTYAQTKATEIQAEQSSLLSADTATVATNLQMAETQHQALISVVSTLSQNNLFSYLK